MKRISLDMLTMAKKTRDNNGYMISLVDQHTKFTSVFANEDKKPAEQDVQTFVALRAYAFDVWVKCLH